MASELRRQIIKEVMKERINAFLKVERNEQMHFLSLIRLTSDVTENSHSKPFWPDLF